VIAVAVVGELPYSAHLKVSKNTKAKKNKKTMTGPERKAPGTHKGN